MHSRPSTEAFLAAAKVIVADHNIPAVAALRVRAHLVRRAYKKGIKITRDQMNGLDLTNDETLPKWNYTLQPV